MTQRTDNKHNNKILS